ncbi:hypothetical protein GCM10010507_39220 [Streptomyces cinnamoneus]|uniref:Uncharacterized protein n=2 Tax=Streptomyces cinnamoneus TaxID=53446 RepID=A0A918TQF0_STRCJ|nr:hypothetical protein GCM10010507_39220 [Streptomyces cinnamoneus]
MVGPTGARWRRSDVELGPATATFPRWRLRRAAEPAGRASSSRTGQVGRLYQPLVLWGPLLAAVTVSYYRRRTSSV